MSRSFQRSPSSQFGYVPIPSHLDSEKNEFEYEIFVLVYGVTAAYPASQLLDPDQRSAWIQQQVQDAKDKFLDGLNIDTEDPIAEGSPETAALTTLAQDTTNAFHEAIEGSQVTFDIAWSPDGIDGRFYDAVGLANAVDFLFVMAYDEQSQIKDSECTARANSGLPKTSSGSSWRHLDIIFTCNVISL